jgi:hypothetical protein
MVLSQDKGHLYAHRTAPVASSGPATFANSTLARVWAASRGCVALRGVRACVRACVRVLRCVRGVRACVCVCVFACVWAGVSGWERAGVRVHQSVCDVRLQKPRWLLRPAQLTPQSTDGANPTSEGNALRRTLIWGTDVNTHETMERFKRFFNTFADAQGQHKYQKCLEQVRGWGAVERRACARVWARECVSA